MHDITHKIMKMPLPKIGETDYHVHLGLPDKGRAIKGLDNSTMGD